MVRREILQAHTQFLPIAGASWHDVPMVADGEGWSLELPLAEAGYFKAKAYLVDPEGWQKWPDGPDVGISVHPDRYRTANTLYCAFPRLFGPGKAALTTEDADWGKTLKPLDQAGYTVIPPSGKLRDLIPVLPHIIHTLGCRILHLLPIHPTPTTYARFGRFGSPYAALDLTAIDPALVVFDRKTTGIDQFRELSYATHLEGGRVFLDIVINHTGWGSVLQDTHPEWFLRQGDGTFLSPGAWGVTWEDLVELDHANVPLWDGLSEVLLTWCRRGVDGFRCDAGYKVPVRAWQYIITRVQQEFPETVFLLEGLGGAWESTEALLTEGGMQWAYSELFQNFSGLQVSGYLDHSLGQSQRTGVLVHYSETHDNLRLAAKGRAWSLLRNRLCALTSVSGGFGFTGGVEWLATEKIEVHGSTGLAWDNPDNLVPELAQLGRLLSDHPCFYDGALLTRLSPPESPIYALWRRSAEGLDSVLVLLNAETEKMNVVELDLRESPHSPQTPVGWALAEEDGLPTATPSVPAWQIGELSTWVDLLGQTFPEWKSGRDGKCRFTLAPGAAYCLAPQLSPRGLHGDTYRRMRAQAAWGVAALNRLIPSEQIGRFDWRVLAGQVNQCPGRFLAAVSLFAGELTPGKTVPSGADARLEESPSPSTSREAGDLGSRLKELLNELTHHEKYSRVVSWTLPDRQRVTPVPPDHWLLIEDRAAFRATLAFAGGNTAQHVESTAFEGGHFAYFAPVRTGGEAALHLERYSIEEQHIEARIIFLVSSPDVAQGPAHPPRATDVVLLTNQRGGMARVCLDLGRVLSKYDCVLGANLHPDLPVDRHVLAKRIRVWVSADGFISPLDFRSVASFTGGPIATWEFVASAGDGRTVEIRVTARMLNGQNATVFQFSRPTAALATGKQLPSTADVRLTVRVDIEDRNFHSETKRNGGADFHFSSNVRPLSADKQVGFGFTPAADRQLRVFADAGRYHPQPEWSENIPHPVEQSRGQVGAGDAFSPGWFDLPLPKGANVTLVLTAEPARPDKGSETADAASENGAPEQAGAEDPFFQELRRAIESFVVRRGSGKTVIAGYPWFLDWGRDSFICARGLLAAGMVAEVRQLLITFARFEKAGTLPNTIFGADASNRDTSDAPLWFGVVCEELAGITGPIEALPIEGGRTLGAVLESIASNYAAGTPNGIRMDPESALIWSPSHFTWMDTNYPACTPREGYPIEIQALWIRLLRQLGRIGSPGQRGHWQKLADQALVSLEKLFWLEDRGYFADVLLAPRGQPAASATADDALRSNCLLVVSLGLSSGKPARRCVEAAARYLVIPGALRSLAPLAVRVPLANRAPDGRLLNDPSRPYWGHYEGDEDTRRKPAYHNGTAWTWTFPVFCEALARAWEFAPESTAAARAYLGSMAQVLSEGCLGQIPEILDGDAPHTQRGCDAQAWGATEALRVWKLLPREP